MEDYNQNSSRLWLTGGRSMRMESRQWDEGRKLTISQAGHVCLPQRQLYSCCLGWIIPDWDNTCNPVILKIIISIVLWIRQGFDALVGKNEGSSGTVTLDLID